MDLTILGANGTYPTAGGACSGYLLEHEEHVIWMDAGNGTLSRLQERRPLEDVAAIFLSHGHPDHCADLYPFFYWLMLREDAAPLSVFAPPGVRERLATLIGADSQARFATLLDWHSMSPGIVEESGPFRLEAFDSAHSTPNVTLRASAGGATLCYSGDTGPNEHLARAARDTDLFLCEASWLEDEVAKDRIHLTARQAGAAARDAQTARLVLTHIRPRCDVAQTRAQASEAFGAPVDLAIDLAMVTL